MEKTQSTYTAMDDDLEILGDKITASYGSGNTAPGHADGLLKEDGLCPGNQRDQGHSSPDAGENMSYRAGLRDRKRIVVKVGSSSLLHSETGRLDYHKIDVLVRELSDLKNRGKDVILVSSGATAVGREVIRISEIFCRFKFQTLRTACCCILDYACVIILVLFLIVIENELAFHSDDHANVFIGFHYHAEDLRINHVCI